MSILDKIRGFFGGSRRSKRLYVVDAARLFGGGGGDRLSPRDQVQVLHQLARFAQKEEIAIQAVFEGRPLREVADGGEFNGVTVYFADQASGLADVFVDRVRSGLRRGGVVAITANRQLEESATGLGAVTMRPSTLRKAMEGSGGGGDGGGRDRSGPPRQRSRRRGRGGGGGGRPPQQQQQQQQPQQGQQQQPPASQPESSARPADPSRDAVRDMIDLVDE